IDVASSQDCPPPYEPPVDARRAGSARPASTSAPRILCQSRISKLRSARWVHPVAQFASASRTPQDSPKPRAVGFTTSHPRETNHTLFHWFVSGLDPAIDPDSQLVLSPPQPCSIRIV